MTSEVQWYPSPPKDELSVELDTVKNLLRLEINHIKEHGEKVDDSVYDELNVKYTSTNKWQSISNNEKESVRRLRPKGVEVRKLPSSHVLAGQYGLFATEKFNRFDIVWEYTGKIVGKDVGGHYVAALEDKGPEVSLGIDAEKTGNEMRFINSYLNVAFRPNVKMRTAYINGMPHLLIICTEDIEPNEELLLDYGDGYNEAFLKPKVKIDGALPNEQVDRLLPFQDRDSDSETDIPKKETL